ncbi:MAG TPA: adenylate/guanylate cyclase domain-containing protein [Geminicoccaceae bacterium]|nr:adenylate/guanylate cyclase domain-containing protein [Geminicoccaceae bacterium]
MTAELVVADRGPGQLLGRVRSFLFGPPLPAHLPERVQTTIRQDQDQTEILVSLMQLLAVASFAALYTLTPKGFDPQAVPFEPVPVTLAVYAAFTLIRLWLAWRRRLRPWFLALSVVVDISVLMVTIWSFHLQYQEPPPLYLKAPTMLYAFILIALRTLRFEPWLVLLAGVTAAAGWLVLVAYAVLGEGGAQMTRDFATYAMSYQVLLGAEIDKVVSLMMVTLILTLGLMRARKLLFRAVTEQVAASELARFFAPEVAGRIRESDLALEPGQAEFRTAAIVMVDMRGFTPLSHRLAPRDVMALLSEYQSRVVAAITEHGGSIDKFMGDGVLASFGATRATTTFAADALRALEALLETTRSWAEQRAARGLPAPGVGAAVATGPVMFGTIGDDRRLEYTVIGDPVNLVAKLEKHSKLERFRALCTAEAYQTARSQGYQPGTAPEPLGRREIAGVDEPLELVGLSRLT